MFQKAYIIASLHFISISTGFVFGQMAGVIGSLQKREEGIDLTEGQQSFIASSLTLVSFIGLVTVALISNKIGRRWPFILFSITKMINWAILYQAREMYQFVLSRIIGGISVGAMMSLNMIVISEYTTPNTRTFFLNLICLIAPAIGTSSGHILGIFLHWRMVALIGIFAAALGVVLPYFWVESPHWLASKGRFEECEEAFRKLHGKSQNSEKQLHLIVKLETKKLELSNQSNSTPLLKRFVVVLKKKYMWDIFILNMFMHVYLAASGKIAYGILGSVIIEDLTGASNVFVFTLIVDGFLLLGPCISCLIIRKCSMRSLLFSTGFTANFILVILSLCYYFRNGQTYFDWINVGLLALYFLIINTGPYPVIEAIYSEIFPLELKSYVFSISGSILMLAFSLSVFLLPYIVRAVGYHGLFLINAAIMSLSLGYIWLKLPETKGKTLQEIEIFFKTRNFDVEEVLSNEQSKALI